MQLGLPQLHTENVESKAKVPLSEHVIHDVDLPNPSDWLHLFCHGDFFAIAIA
jgi:hypothetical protein